MHVAVRDVDGLNAVISDVELLLHTRARLVACSGNARHLLRTLGVFAQTASVLCNVSRVPVLTTIVTTYRTVCDDNPECWCVCLTSLEDIVRTLDESGSGAATGVSRLLERFYPSIVHMLMLPFKAQQRNQQVVDVELCQHVSIGILRRLLKHASSRQEARKKSSSPSRSSWTTTRTGPPL